MIWNKDMKTGYVSSNRNRVDRIFEFVVNPYIVTASGKVESKESKAALAGATVIFTNVTTGAIDSVTTASDGTYTFQMLNESDYTMEVRKTGYFSVKKEGISAKNITENKAIENNFVLQELVVDKPVVIETPDMIFYDLDKADIRTDAKPELDKLINHNH